MKFLKNLSNLLIGLNEPINGKGVLQIVQQFS